MVILLAINQSGDSAAEVRKEDCRKKTLRYGNRNHMAEEAIYGFLEPG